MDLDIKLECVICGLPENRVCSHCGLEGYCGKEHQKQAWPNHKEHCKPWQLTVNEKFGRHLVTTKNLKAGELIIKESPIVIGPRVDSAPVCLGCHRALRKLNFPFPIQCDRCKIPVFCSEDCQKITSWHVSGECQFFSLIQNAEEYPVWENLQVVLPLRCYALKESNPEAWEKFIALQSHRDERKETPIWQLHKEGVVNNLKNLGILKNDEECSIMEEICGILDVNCFELRGPNPALMTSQARGECLRGVYLTAAMLAHDCLGNTHVSVDESFRMAVHSSVSIAKGEPILFNYASSLECTPERLKRLEEGKCFTCICRRCTDPTELGTYMSAITCPRCHNGNVTPVHDGLSPLRWICNQCEHSYDAKLLKRTLDQAWSLIEEADQSDVRVMKALLKRLSRTFPPTSVVIVEIKQNLVALYRDIILREPIPTRSVLQKKINLCIDLLQVLQAVEPGISRLRGITLYELHVPLVILANREYDSGEITGEQLAEKLETAHATLRDAVEMLVYEPINSPEGQLLKMAMDELRALRENMTQLHAMNQDNPGQKKHQNNKKNNSGKSGGAAQSARKSRK